jgi:hypothetical protein
VTSSVLLRQTALACAILAVAAVVALLPAGRATIGFGLAAGLLLGSFNGYLIRGFLNRGAPFVAASLLRLVLLSSLVLMAFFMLRGDAWTVALGIGLAQLVMVAVGIRLGLQR